MFRILEELSQLLPFPSVQTFLDKTSIIRLSLTGLKVSEVVSSGEQQKLGVSVNDLSSRSQHSESEGRESGGL